MMYDYLRETSAQAAGTMTFVYAGMEFAFLGTVQSVFLRCLWVVKRMAGWK